MPSITVSPSSLASFDCGDFIEFVEWALTEAPITSTSGTLFTLSGFDVGGEQIVANVSGSSFTYGTGASGPYLTGGTITNVAVTYDGVFQGNIVTNVVYDGLAPIVEADLTGANTAAIENYLFGFDWTYNGTNADDVTPSFVGDSVAFNPRGNDIFNGNGGNDSIYTGDGNDILNGGPGSDILNGGPGSDTVDYSGSNAGVAFNLTAGSPIGGHAAGDTLISIENIIGSNFNDGIGGNAANNILNGGPGNDAMTGVAGNDTLLGGAGNDLLVGSHGHDTINGGPGNDFASYANALTGVIVSLISGKGFGGHAAGDTLISIEHLAGWHFDDNLTGNAFGNIVDGKGGNDILHGAAGNDNVIGGDGNDWVYGDGGADILEGRSGNDVLVGGALFDFFRYRQADFGRDHILDYQDGLDQIWLTGSGLTFDDFTVAQAGAHTVLTLDADNSIMLHNTNAALIDAGDFIV